MLRTLRGFNDSNFPAFFGRILSMLRKEGLPAQNGYTSALPS